METAYFESGRVKTEKPWKNNRMHGKEKWYWPSGRLKQVIPWNNGAEHGTEVEYDEKGRVIRKTNWDNGNAERYHHLHEGPKVACNGSAAWCIIWGEGEVRSRESEKQRIREGALVRARLDVSGADGRSKKREAEKQRSRESEKGRS